MDPIQHTYFVIFNETRHRKIVKQKYVSEQVENFASKMERNIVSEKYVLHNVVEVYRRRLRIEDPNVDFWRYLVWQRPVQSCQRCRYAKY